MDSNSRVYWIDRNAQVSFRITTFSTVWILYESMILETITLWFIIAFYLPFQPFGSDYTFAFAAENFKFVDK